MNLNARQNLLRSRTNAWIIACIVAIGVYLVAGLVVMLRAPKVPYADVWGFLVLYLRADFPHDIATPVNGHHELLPNLVRVFELRLLGGGQWLQIAVGIALLLGTLIVCWRAISRHADRQARWAAALAVTLGLCWLGSERALGHANESVHAYFVTLFLMLGAVALTGEDVGRNDVRPAVWAALCGIGATFSFGSGIASFIGFFAVLALRRSSARVWAVLGAGLLTAVVLLVLNPGPEVPVAFAPMAQLVHLLRWLSTPAIYAVWPALDPAVAAQVPAAGIREPLQVVAQAYAEMAGPVMLARWPHLVIGAAGLAWLAASSWSSWRRPQASALPGLAMAWFACAAGGMIALARHNYLQIYPDQLLAPRYVVWSSLFWCGLGWHAALQVRRPRSALVWTVLVAIALLPSQVWMYRLAANMRQAAEQTALAAVVGVIDPGMRTGESVPAEVWHIQPDLARRGLAMYRWPEVASLGRPMQRERLVSVDAQDLQVIQVDNRAGAPGRRVVFRATPHAPRVLLVDGDGVVRGLALPDPASGRDHWIGWMRGRATGSPQVWVIAP